MVYPSSLVCQLFRIPSAGWDPHPASGHLLPSEGRRRISLGAIPGVGACARPLFAYPGLISVSLSGLKPVPADMRQLSEGRRNSGRQSLPEPADRRSAPHLRCSSARVLRRRPGSHPGPARAGFNRQSAIGNRQFPEPEPELGWQGAAFVEHWNGSWHET